jgi:hypothetical protein
MSWPGGEIKFFESFLLWIRYAVKDDWRGDRMGNCIADDTGFRVAPAGWREGLVGRLAVHIARMHRGPRGYTRTICFRWGGFQDFFTAKGAKSAKVRGSVSLETPV